MSKSLFLFLSLFSFFSLYGLEEYLEPKEVTTTEGLPSSLVNQSVCAISGEYTDSIVDVVLPGPEPLVISRVYTSFSREKPWSFNHYDKLILGDVLYNHQPAYVIGFRQPSHAQLDYVYEKTEQDHKLRKVSFRLIVPKGLTNGASALSGKTNIRNQTLHFYPKQDLIVSESGAGNRKIFKKIGRTEEGWPICGQIYEEKVNGSRIRYEGKGKGMSGAEEIICENKESKKRYSAVKFSERHLGGEMFLQTLTTSDERKLAYFFKHHGYRVKEKERHAEHSYSVDRFYLTKVQHPYAPHEKYHYEEKALSPDMHITVKSRDEGKRFLKIDYYHKGVNQVGGNIGCIDIKEKDDFRLDRVKKLQAPVGADQTPITTHRFDYHATIKKHKEDGHKKVAQGYTDVYDAKNHKTRYSYDEEHRLISMIRYSGRDPSTYAPYTEECFVWDEKGCLLAKIFKDGAGSIHHARLFTYDSYGNVVTSTLCGKLTGKPSPPLLFDSQGRIVENGYERETKTYIYSQDGLNLLLSEEDSAGKAIRYAYKKNSDLLKAKYLSYDGQIRLREFSFYDRNHACVQKILDDGCQEESEDLCFANERHVTLIIPRKEAPVGLPESVEEWAHDFFHPDPILLKRSTYRYSPQGRLLEQQVFDANGSPAYSLHWDYDLHGNLTQETNAMGVSVEKTYDPATDNLIQQNLPDLTIINTYDFANRLIEKKEIHPDGEYVTSNRFDYLGNCKAIANSQGHTTHQYFDDFGRVVEIHDPKVPKDGGLVAPVEKTSYDIAGFPISLTDANGGVTHLEVNIRGQPTKIIYPDGTKEEMTYSVQGWLMQKIAKNGARTEYVRDPLGRITQESIYGEGVKQTLYRYNAFHLIESIDPEGNCTTYAYDAAGRLKETLQQNRRKEHFYDSLGRLSEIREYDEPNRYRALIKSYDSLDRVIEERLQNAEGETLHLSRYEYDMRGNKTLVQTGDQTIRTEYNSWNQPTKIIDGLGHTTHIHYQRDFINPYGQKVLQKRVTDPLGYQTIETYDAASRLAERLRLNPLGEKIARQAFFYDLLGNETQREEEVIEEVRVMRTLLTVMTYDAMSQITQMIEAAGTPEQKITRIRYNAFGQKEALIKPDGKEITYTYDAFGRLKTHISSDRSIAYLYEYNLLDQAVSVIDQTSGKATQREYAQGKIQKETLANGLSLSLTYDQTGRARTILFPDGTGIEYVYNAVDLKEVYRLIHGQRTYGHADLHHSLSGQVTQARPPGNNGVTSYEFDPLDRCRAIEATHFCQHVPPDGFDAAGNLVKCDMQNIAYSFTYDGYSHIQSETGHSSHTYSFDSLSNRISKNEEKYQYNALNQLMRGQELMYDPNGNLIRSGPYEYAYDALDRLVQVSCKGALTRYSYDAFNRRISKTIQGEEELFLYQGQEEIGRWKNGVCQEMRLLGKNQQSQTVALEIQGIPYVPLHDIHGNIVSLATLQGEVVEGYRYTAFGEREILSPSGERRSTSVIGNPWQYASKRFEEESGLIAFGMRYYDPDLGRWTTPDPAGFVDGSNLYAYVHNNPLQYSDRFGLFAESFLFGGIGLYTSLESNYERFCLPLGMGGSCDLGRESIWHFNIENKLEKDFHFRKKETDPLFHRTKTYSANEFINPETEQYYQFKEMPPNKKILFMNGIDNKLSDFRESLLHLGNMTGYNVQGVFCPTFGKTIDAICYKHALLDGAAYEGVRELQKHIKDFHENSSPGATMLLIPHSRGAVYARNGLRDSPPEERDSVDVRAFACGAYIDPYFCKSVIHYESKRDVVPWLDVAGRKRCRDTIMTLEPHPNAPWFDHAFTSPTYAESLEFAIKRYMGK